MNKVVNINLNGIIITIDEEAYERLKNYIDQLRKHFSGTEGSAEIISDIETRIAELLQLKLNATYQVILLKDVEEVIAIMGLPGDMDSEGQEQAQQEQKSTTQQATARKLKRDTSNKMIGGVCAGLGNYFNIDPLVARAAFLISFFVFGSGLLLYVILWAVMPEATADEVLQYNAAGNRKLYRNPDNKMLGGVCSGIAAYLGIDEIWVRLAFAGSFFFFGSGLLAYIILWLIIPEAKSSAEKLQMKGLQIHVNNIEQEVRNAAAHVRAKAPFIPKALSLFLKIVIGLLLLFIIVVFVIPSAGVLAFLNLGTDADDDIRILFESLTITPEIFMLAKWGINLLVISVLASLLAFVVRLFVKFRLSLINALTGFVFVISIILLVMAGVKYASEVDEEGVYVEEVKNVIPADTLTIKINDVQGDDANKFDVTFDDEVDEELEHSTWVIKDGELLLNQPELKIKPIQAKEMEVMVKKEARGKTTEKAEKIAEAISMNLEVKPDLISFNNLASPGKDKGYRYQEASVGIKIPVGTVIRFQTTALELVDDFDSDYGDAGINKYVFVKVTDDGLKCLTCDNPDEIWELNAKIEESVTDSTSKDGKTKVKITRRKMGPISIDFSKTETKK